jgi:CRP-like cAMP-binding protein
VSPAEDTASTIERMLVLKALPFLAGVHPDELAAVAEHVVAREFRRGELLFGGDGAPVTSIHLVLEGRVAERRDGRVFRTHGPQRVLGGIEALALAGDGVEAVAEEDTRTLAIERADLHEVLEDNFGVLSATLHGVAGATLRLRRRLVPSAGFPDEAEAGDVEPGTLCELAARVGFLRRYTWLQCARIRTLGQLAREARLVSLADGESLWGEGDAAEDAAVVVRGIVACATSDGAHRFEAGRGTILGLEEALAMEGRWHGAVARETVSVLRITRVAVVDVLEDDADTALEVLAAFARVAAQLRTRIACSLTGGT